MPYPISSSRQRRRQLNIGRRLVALFDALSDETVRHSALSKADAGAWRRTLSESTALLGPGDEPPPDSRRPAEFFVSTVAKMHALTRLKRLHDKASRPRSWASYPRSLRRV